MLLKVVDESGPTPTFRDIPIREGEMFLLPPDTPHNPIRFASTVGIVLEQPRPEHSLDRLRWYCQGCSAIVYEAAFHCTDLGTQIKAAVVDFTGDKEKRTCGECGALLIRYLVVLCSREDSDMLALRTIGIRGARRPMSGTCFG